MTAPSTAVQPDRQQLGPTVTATRARITNLARSGQLPRTGATWDRAAATGATGWSRCGFAPKYHRAGVLVANMQ
jgi:hypothetical protein